MFLSRGGYGIFRHHFHVGKFPEVGVYDALGALADQEFAIAFNDEGEEVAGGWRDALAEIGQCFLAAGFESDA